MKCFLAIALLTAGILSSCVTQSDPDDSLARFPKSAHMAMKYIVKSQNPDGSWGEGQDRTVDSALAMAMFVQSGETELSEKYGEVFKKGRRWILEAMPKTTADRVSLIMALSCMQTSSYATQNKHLNVRITTLLADVKKTDERTWIDLLATVRLPKTVQSPEWLVNHVIDLNHPAYTAGTSLETVEDYIRFYLTTVFERRLSPRLLEKNGEMRDLGEVIFRKNQRDDGWFRAKGDGHAVACTSLMVLRRCLIYRWYAIYFEGDCEMTRNGLVTPSFRKLERARKKKEKEDKGLTIEIP